MPPKTRGDKVSKMTKENINANIKTKLKTKNKLSKIVRAALADKTNSPSDDSEIFLPRKDSKQDIQNARENLLAKQRPRRERRVPTRYIESNVLQHLSNGKNTNSQIEQPINTPVEKIPIVVLTPLKTPIKTLDHTLTVRRPKRVCRLPSKFDNHSISPSKFVSVHPAFASTPKRQNKSTKTIENKEQKSNVNSNKTPLSNKVISSKIIKQVQLKKKDITKNKSLEKNKNKSPDKTKNKDPYKIKNKGLDKTKNKSLDKTKNKSPDKTKNKSPDKTKNKSPDNTKRICPDKIKNRSPDRTKHSSPDTNNNAKKYLLPRNKTKNIQNKSSEATLKKILSPTKKITSKNHSVRILDDNKKSLKRSVSNVDIYEFTYDPNEEPPPQKKKRKKPTKKREPKPKMFIFKNNYDRNMTKALMALKNTVSSKSTKAAENTDTVNGQAGVINPTSHSQARHSTQQDKVPDIISIPTKQPAEFNRDKSLISEKNYKSVRVEDIALDFEQDNVVDDINYSPLNSPNRPVSPVPCNKDIHNISDKHNDDPLNLRDDFSFFDDQPVASSSMNVSVRHPTASPWRVEFGHLPIKWQVNTYVKPNMTPAFESSFLNFNDTKKKHVYTNLGSETNESHDLPQIFEDNTSKLKQTSIVSFIKEVVEKNAKKRKEKLTPIKANSLFENIHGASICNVPSPQKQVTPEKTDHKKVSPETVDSTPSKSNRNSDLSKGSSDNDNSNSKGDKENSEESVKKRSKRKHDRDLTYFGFDDSENHDQENLSPAKKVDKRNLRAMKPHSRAVLQEINDQKGPTRAVFPIAARPKPSQGPDTVNELFDQMKSATEPPVFLDKEAMQNTETVNVTEVQTNGNTNDGDSVHLFEDLEFIHHLKAHRKSYGKAKKAVTFRQNSISDSDVPLSDAAEQSASSDEDDRFDLTFKVPAAVEPRKAVKKKKTNKQKLSKKEKQEVDAWAAGFNSMCEDIEEFDLIVE